MLDHPGPNLVAEQALQQVFVQRQRALRKDRVAELLKFVENFMVQAGVVMIGPAEHHNADAVLAFKFVEHIARLVPHLALICFQRFVPGLNRALVLFWRQAEQRLERGEHLVREQFAILQVENRVDVLHVVFREDVTLLGVRGFDRLGTGRHRRACV